MAMKNRKPVPKVKINSHVAEALKRANLVPTNIKEGQDLNINKSRATTICIIMQQDGPSMTW